MKNIMLYLVCSCILLMLGGCSKEPTPMPPDVNNGDNYIVWKHKRDYNSLASVNYIYKNTLIQGVNSQSDHFKVVALTLDSGKLVWETPNLATTKYFNPFDNEQSILVGNSLYLSDRGKMYSINVVDGAINWEDDYALGSYSVCEMDGKIYRIGESSVESSLFEYESTGSKTKLFSITKDLEGDNQYEPALSMPVKWIDDNGNTLLILSSRGYAPIGGSYRMDIMAWNVTADSMEWYRKGLEERGSSTRPIIDDNRVYFYSIFKLHCIDANTGETIWDWETDPRDNFGGFKTANMLMVGNKMIVKPDSYWMYALDKMTGQRIWVNENTSPMPSLLREHQDTIWFSSGGVFGIDANTGWKLIDDWDKANTSGFWGNAIIHHPTNGYIYTTDGDYIYCLDPRYMN